MKLLVIFSLLVISAASSQARLGESIKELKRRYGQPIDVQETREAGADRYTFQWQQYTIAVTVLQGLSVSEEFTRQNAREFSLEEVRLLLAESTPGLTWAQVNGNTWKQRDRVASWSRRSLVVQEKARAK